MDRLQLEEKEFEVAKYLAYWMHNERYVSSYYLDALEKELRKAKRSNELILFNFFRKQIEETNSQIRATQTRLNNLRYSGKWRTSSLFKGLQINYREIERLIKEQPEAEPYDIYLKMKDYTIL
jgi:hypothetical protein